VSVRLFGVAVGFAVEEIAVGVDTHEAVGAGWLRAAANIGAGLEVDLPLFERVVEAMLVFRGEEERNAAAEASFDV